ncbi:MAG: S41 family peptidase [Pirellula sp.]|jgi:carboxyl-terminal processing protease
MKNSNLRTLSAWAIGFLLLGPVPQVVADFPNGGNAPASVETDVLESGRLLEQERRWHEAILHYERTVRKNPEFRTAAERLQVCRVHHDVTRRYSDRSFLQAVDASSVADALKVYSEVIAKLEVYYVDRIDYYKLALHGTAFLEVALTEPDFLGKHVRNSSRESVEEFRKNIHKSVFGRRITTAEELKQTATFVAKQAYDSLGLSSTAVIYEYIAGSIGLLDPYSALLTPGEYQEVMSGIEGNLIGLGIELWAEGTELRIVDVFRGGPAYFAGLSPKQHILKVDGVYVHEIGAKRAADMLRGPEGSSVELQLRTIDDRMLDVKVERRKVDVPSVSIAEMADPAVGYIRITNFQKTTTNEVSKAMLSLSGQGMRSLIIDLRRNPGGLLDAAVELADLFLDAGTIVSTHGRNGQENHNFTAKRYGTWDIPLVVLIDEDSASASEIFAGAMHDHHRATIVGQTSYGKGSVQGVFHNENGNGGLRLTVSKFYSPNGTPISNNGVRPNVPVEIESTYEPRTLDLVAKRAEQDKKVLISAESKVDLVKERGIEMAKQKIQLKR